MPTRFAAIALFLIALVFSAQQTRDATLRVRIADPGGKPVPARVLITTAAGTPIAAEPDGAVPVLWGRNDRAEGYVFAAGGAFYADGSFWVRLPPGEYRLEVSKGNEFLPHSAPLRLEPGKTLVHGVRLERWIDMPARGWYSADDHIHLQRAPRDNPAILRWVAAEDVHVGNILEMGDFWATYFTQHAFGPKGRYKEGNNILSPGQEEPRTPEIGHTISLGASELVRFPDDYYTYGRIFDQVHELGGISGFAHQAELFHGYRGMVLTALAGKVDLMELVQFCADGGPLITKHYYQFLDLGVRLTALAGSDYPWCGLGPRYGVEKGAAQIGNARFYTYVRAEFSFERWLDAVKAGHTFATTGPILEFTLNGKLPGETVDVKPGEKVHVVAKAYGHSEQIPLSELEVVVHGETVAGVADSKDQLSIEKDIPVEHGFWIAARARAKPFQVAHTTPVYVTVNGGGFQNPKTAPRYLSLAEDQMKELEAALAAPGSRLDQQAARHRARLEAQITAARGELATLRSSWR